MARKAFATVGSTNFTQLIQSLVQPDFLQTLSDHGYGHLTLQTGTSDLSVLRDRLGKSRVDSSDCDIINYGTHHGVTIESYAFKPSIESDIANSHLVIGHAGAGTTLEALRANKRFIAVVNPTLMNNHQAELAHELSRQGYLFYCYPDDLLQALTKAMREKSLKTFPEFNPQLFANYVEKVITEKLLGR